ncbi:unnamed protein product [Cuscuta epithymum]|uniref:Uncharacterized protein n=1 Tax=Cuscuta epithymum TaxID=186058 RepID=A0AAV0ELX6_9ASTE|nr:unnamed protein product [Cuscuta epithymum]
MMKKMSSPCPSLPSPVNDTEVQPESSTAMPNPAKPVAKRSRKQKRVVHSSDSPGHGQAKRSSVFRGVTSVKRGRYEAHYWDKSASKKNRQSDYIYTDRFLLFASVLIMNYFIFLVKVF